MAALGVELIGHAVGRLYVSGPTSQAGRGYASMQQRHAKRQFGKRAAGVGLHLQFPIHRRQLELWHTVCGLQLFPKRQLAFAWEYCRSQVAHQKLIQLPLLSRLTLSRQPSGANYFLPKLLKFGLQVQMRIYGATFVKNCKPQQVGSTDPPM